METENTPLQDDISSGQQIGDYLIGDLLQQSDDSMTWAATQVSVQREVAICNLYGIFRQDSQMAKQFMADTRTKATVDHPLISSVLEAIHANDQCFYAREKLVGKALNELSEEGLRLSPPEMAQIIRSIADASKWLEAHNIATKLLTLDDVVLDDKLQCRLVNQAVSGEIDGQVATQDKILISNCLRQFLTLDQSGATRLASLLDFMRDGHQGEPLSWDKIHELADGVDQQLAEDRDALEVQIPQSQKAQSGGVLAKVLIGVAAVALLAGAWYMISNRKTVAPERKLDIVVEIPNGKYPVPFGPTVRLRNFAIDAHEVTIGEYAKFLKALSVISEDQREVYQHKDQPKEKFDHLPEDWDNLYGAATSGETWNGKSVDLNYPVVGVDWWDAFAYAEWKGHRLPTRNEWYAACAAGSKPADLKGTGWMPVDESEKTSLGVYGMAGNVSEWTLERSFDPADPSQPARFIICGASYENLKYGARAFEWVKDRSVRRLDLGFRTCKTTSPTE